MKTSDADWVYRVETGDKGWIIEVEDIIGVTVEDVAEVDNLYYVRVRWDTDRNKVTLVRPYEVLQSEDEVETEVRRKIANLKRNMMLFKVARERARLDAMDESKQKS